jgi:hypothetical protein
MVFAPNFYRSKLGSKSGVHFGVGLGEFSRENLKSVIVFGAAVDAAGILKNEEGGERVWLQSVQGPDMSTKQLIVAHFRTIARGICQNKRWNSLFVPHSGRIFAVIGSQTTRGDQCRPFRYWRGKGCLNVLQKPTIERSPIMVQK